MIAPLSDQSAGELVVRVLPVLVRCSGLVVFCPIFSSQLLPVRFRISFAIALALVLVPLVPAPVGLDGSVVGWLLLVVRELAVGLVLGMVARTLFDGVEGAARLIAAQSGFALSSMVDPLTGGQSVTPALFQTLLATTLILAADLHHLFLRGLVHSYTLLSTEATMLATGGLVDAVIKMGGRLFLVAVELAAPGLVVTFAVDLVLVLVGRAMPQVPVLIVGYPLKVASGLVALLLMSLATGSALGWIGRTLSSDGATLLAALSGK